MQRKKAGIVIFDDVEVLDFCGPFEVLSVTRLDEARRREEPSPFEPILVAHSTQPVAANGGLTVLPQTTFADCPQLDILIVPGGWGTRRAMTDEPLLRFVKEQAAQAQTVASVCTGSLVLGKAGLLDGRRATTHWAALDFMQELFPSVQIDRESHVVEVDNIFTAAGISAGIDMALHLVARHFGESIAKATAHYMEYPYPEHNRRRVKIPPSSVTA